MSLSQYPHFQKTGYTTEKKKNEIHDIRLVPNDQKKMPEIRIGIVIVEV